MPASGIARNMRICVVSKAFFVPLLNGSGALQKAGLSFRRVSSHGHLNSLLVF